MIIRYSVSTILGVVVTLGLFLFMHSLIATGKGAYTDAQSFRLVDFVRVEREEIVRRRRTSLRNPQSRRRARTSLG